MGSGLAKLEDSRSAFKMLSNKHVGKGPLERNRCQCEELDGIGPRCS